MTAPAARARYAPGVRAILIVCALAGASGCELYFGPASSDAAPNDSFLIVPDGGIVEPDAAALTPPDPPATCSTILVYVVSEPGDPRGPFVSASIADALRFYHVPITAATAPPTSGLSLTLVLSPRATTAVDVPTSCMLQIGGTATIADDRSRSNEEIVANALHGLGVLYTFPAMIDAGDCMNDTVVPGCRFGRADTVQADPCGYWEFGKVDEAQMLATDLGCPGVGK